MKCLKFIALAAAAAIICAGCSPQEQVASSQEVSVLKIIKPNYIPEFSNAVAEFNEANSDIQINFVDAPTATAERHDLYVAALSGRDESTDIYLINDEWTEEFAECGYIMPITEELSIDNSQYIVDAQAMFSYNNDLYALPIGLDTDFIFYRSDLLDKAPENWDEVVKESRSSDSQVPITLCLESADIKDIVYNLNQIMKSSGCTYAEALNFYREITDGYDMEDDIPIDCLSTFKTGGALMMLGKGSYWHKLNGSTSAVRGDVGMMLMSNAGDADSMNYICGYGLAINANSKNKEAAIRFLDFLNSKEQQQQLSRDSSIMPVITELYEDEMILDTNPYMSGLGDAIKNAETYKSIGVEGEALKRSESALHRFFGKEETSNNTGKELSALLQ